MTIKDVFIKAIHGKRKISLTFYSKEDNAALVRKCAPMDYGPSRRAKNKAPRFHCWDYESDTGRHTLSLLDDQVIDIKMLDERFDPAEFVTWSVRESPWFVPRNWGDYS